MFSVGEEGIGNLKGIRSLVEDRAVPPRLFVSFDLCYNTFTLDGVGSNRYQTDVRCPGGHSWNDFGNPNAIELLVELLARLKVEYRKVVENCRAPVSYNIGHVSGGNGVTSIARHAAAQFEFRSAEPESLQMLDSRVRAVAADLGATDDVTLSLDSLGQRPAAKPVGADWIESLIRDVWAAEGLAPVTQPRSTNINMTLASGWPSVCVGLCQSYGHHREDEYVRRDSLSVGWRLLMRLTKRLVLDAK